MKVKHDYSQMVSDESKLMKVDSDSESFTKWNFISKT